MGGGGGRSTARLKALLAPIAPQKAPERQKAQAAAPTPEQQQKATFERGSSKTAHGQVNSVAYRRQPLFETLFKGRNSGISLDALTAMRVYRERHEATATSLTKCALDIQGRGGGLPSCLPPGLEADYLVRHIETALGPLADTMRRVVLEDQSFSDVAIARFGSRVQNWIESEKQRVRTKKGARMVFVEKIVPKSGRHREIIRDEFMAGLDRLVAAVRPHIRTGGE